MDTAQPGQGLELMLYGMGTVVLFLVVLVYATRLMTFVTRRFFPERAAPARRAAPPPAGPPEGAAEGAAAPGGDAPTLDPRLLAAIAAAVHAHSRRAHP